MNRDQIARDGITRARANIDRAVASVRADLASGEDEVALTADLALELMAQSHVYVALAAAAMVVELAKAPLPEMPS